MGRGFKPKGGRGRGRGRGYAAQQEQEEDWRAQQARKRRGEDEETSEEEETSDDDDDEEDSSSGDEEEEKKDEKDDDGEKIVKVKDFDRFAGIGVQKEEEEESSDEEDDSSSSSSFEDEYLKPKAKPKAKAVDEGPPPKSAKQLAEEMEKLRLVRERRAAQAKARIDAEGFDRYAPPEAGGRPRVE